MDDPQEAEFLTQIAAVPDEKPSGCLGVVLVVILLAAFAAVA